MSFFNTISSALFCFLIIATCPVYVCKLCQVIVTFLSPQPLAQITARITAPSPWSVTTLTTLCRLLLSSVPHLSVTTSKNVLYKYLPSPRLSSLVLRRGQTPMWQGMWLPDAVPLLSLASGVLVIWLLRWNTRNTVQNTTVTPASSYFDSWEQRADCELFDQVIGVGFPEGGRERLLFRASR